MVMAACPSMAGMDLIDYLNLHFLTRAQLLAHTCLTGARLDALQAAGMMPRPSYRLQVSLGCDSFFGPHTESHALDWYARGYVAWSGLVDALDGPLQAYAMFADRYRRRLAGLAVDKQAPYPQDLAGDAHIAAEWQHFLDGTYGLRTCSGLSEDIAVKEAAIVTIRALTAQGEARVLDQAGQRRLAAAVDLLDQTSAPFAPHEMARSSRRRWVDEVKKAYGL